MTTHQWLPWQREQIETLVEREGERVTLIGSTIVNKLPQIREPGFTDMSNQRREDMLKLVIRRLGVKS